MKTELIQLNLLKLSPLNARQTTNDKSLAELKASITAHGLMQNLVVIDNGLGVHEVIAGGRRLMALHELQAEGSIAETYVVPCVVVENESAAELSLAENIVRETMHPADEFEAFTALAQRGSDVNDIARRFGTTNRHVDQRLRMGKVHPDIVAEYRAGVIPLDCVMAFTINEDQDEQLKAYTSLKGWERNASSIRARVTKKMLRPDGGLVKLIGLEAYKKAGGRVVEDLFGDTTYLLDKKLLDQMVADKVEKQVAKLKKEGWGWVEVLKRYDYSIRSKYDKIEGKTAEEKAEGGCVLWIDAYQGEIKIEKGYKKKEGSDDSVSNAHSSDDDDNARNAAYDIKAEIVRAQLLGEPEYAMELLAFRAASSIFDDEFPFNPSGMDVSFRKATYSWGLGLEKAPTLAKTILADAKAKLQKAWCEGSTEAEHFAAFRKLPVEEKAALLEYAAAVTFEFDPDEVDTAADIMAQNLEINYAEHWRPTVQTYLKFLSRPQLLKLGAELISPSWADMRAGLDDEALARILEEVFADPSSQGFSAEQIDRIATWLPPEMVSVSDIAQVKKAA